MRRAGLAGSQRVGGRQAHVVMRVHLEFQSAIAAQGADALEGGERFEYAERVGKAQAAGTGAFGGFGQRTEEVHVGARGILATDADFKPEGERGANVFRQFAQQPGAVLFQFVGEMLVGGRYRNIDQMHAQVGTRGDVVRMLAASLKAFGQPAKLHITSEGLLGLHGGYRQALCLSIRAFSRFNNAASDRKKPT